MLSFVWDRDPEEAFSNPYEYTAQKQFVKEARVILQELKCRINPRVLRYSRDDKSAEKAIWMLRVDTLDSLCEALELIEEKRHRPAARLFRDALETADLAHYFASKDEKSVIVLRKWYLNSSPNHGSIRKWLENVEGTSRAKCRSRLYSDLSRFTHRTYRALLKSYSLGGDDRLVHDGWSTSRMLVLPHTIAAYYCILAMLIQIFVGQLHADGAMTSEDVARLWDVKYEHDSTRGDLPSSGD
ncbi:MAG: hypothetical protein Q7U75_08580 [Desulfobacterales bacterium]|nr:hypothetical protein [Desulfobacterales bacterium]